MHIDEELEQKILKIEDRQSRFTHSQLAQAPAALPA